MRTSVVGAVAAAVAGAVGATGGWAGVAQADRVDETCHDSVICVEVSPEGRSVVVDLPVNGEPWPALPWTGYVGADAEGSDAAGASVHVCGSRTGSYSGHPDADGTDGDAATGEGEFCDRRLVEQLAAEAADAIAGHLGGEDPHQEAPTAPA